MILGVPTMLIALLKHPDLDRRDLASLRVVASGGAVVPAELVRRIEDRLGVSFSIAYGSTESLLRTQIRLDDAPQERANTLGRPFPQTEIMVCDPLSNQPVAPGVVGELCARGYSIMAGYNRQPEATAC